MAHCYGMVKVKMVKVLEKELLAKSIMLKVPVKKIKVNKISLLKKVILMGRVIKSKIGKPLKIRYVRYLEPEPNMNLFINHKFLHLLAENGFEPSTFGL